MFKSDEEIDKLLNHKNNKGKDIKISGIGRGSNPKSGGHAEGKHEKIPVEEKAEIGILAELVGSKNASELLGLNNSRVGQFKRGFNGMKPDEPLREKLSEKRTKIQESCISKVDQFLELITPEKVEALEVNKIAHTAETMVNIYDKLAMRHPINIEKVQIQFYAPKVREASDYQIIDVEPIKN